LLAAARFRDDDGVGIQVVLVRSSRVVTGLQDPSGGRFDAAGDFDRVLPTADERFAVLNHVEPYGDTVLRPSDMDGFLDEVDRLLKVSNEGSERRGLLRLRALAMVCRDAPDSQLRFMGD
jgi:hypothetical protein